MTDFDRDDFERYMRKRDERRSNKTAVWVLVAVLVLVALLYGIPADEHSANESAELDCLVSAVSCK